MKNVNIKGKFKYLLVAIPVLLCVTIVSIILCSPKENNVSDKQKDTISDLQEVNADLASSPKTSQEEEKPVKYRLIYSLIDTRMITTGLPTVRGEDLLGDSARDFISQFEGQDVYFRVKVGPMVFYDEEKQAGHTEEKGEELRKQRIKYVIDLGAKDMVSVPNTEYSYYASLTAEMIKKIDEARECSLLLVNPPRPDKYSTKFHDSLVYSLESMKEDEKLAVKFSINCENGVEVVDQIFSEGNIASEQITSRNYEERQETIAGGQIQIDKRTYIEGSFTKEQILYLVPNQSVAWDMRPLKEADELIIDVTEGMEIL